MYNPTNLLKSPFRVLFLCVALSFFGMETIQSQSLEDFKKAASSKGVDAIPFSSLRSDAKSASSRVNSAKSSSKFKYDTFEKQKNNMFKSITDKQASIKKLREEIKEFQEDYENFDSSTLEKDIEDIEDEIEDVEENISDLNDRLEDISEAFLALAEARENLRILFSRAKSQVKSAKSSPDDYLGDDASEDDIDDFEDYCDTIEDIIEAGESEHKKQEDGALETAARFDTLRSRTS